MRIAHWLLILIVFAASGAPAQWSNFPTPGKPRTRDGKANLAGPVPRALDGKPDLSGVWMHETTTVAEVRRVFGDRFDLDIALSPAGTEIGTQHKYDNPKTYTKPFTVKIPHYLLPDANIFEMFCNENEKDRVHLERQ